MATVYGCARVPDPSEMGSVERDEDTRRARASLPTLTTDCVTVMDVGSRVYFCASDFDAHVTLPTMRPQSAPTPRR